MSDLRDEDLDLREAFSATAGELDPLARERLLSRAQELGDQAVVQEALDLSAPSLDDLARRRLLAHAHRIAAGQGPARASLAERPTWRRRTRLWSLAAAAAAMLVAGARWWGDAGSDLPKAVVIAEASTNHTAIQQVVPVSAPASVDESMSADLPDFGEGSTGDQGPWEGFYVESDEQVATDLAGQLDSLHGMEASPLDDPTSEWL